MQKLIYLFILISLITSCVKNTESNQRILIVTSNQHTYGNTTQNTSNHFAEIVHAYDVFIKNGFLVDFISPQGGAIPLGYISTSDTIQKHYLYNTVLMNKLKTTKKPSEIDPERYKAIYYSGGGAAMFGVPENETIQDIAKDIYNKRGIISAVCHGTAGIVNLKDKTGMPLYRGKKINGYPDVFERKTADYYKTFPFSIEGKITENQGNFQYTNKRNSGFYIIDGQFITGQDPSSTTNVAKAVVLAIQSKKLI